MASYGNDRYSFKIEFDHYDSTISYHGLDKLSLNNIIQDNTYMKDYLTYQMMGYFGVDAHLCSYVYITVNGGGLGPLSGGGGGWRSLSWSATTAATMESSI